MLHVSYLYHNIPSYNYYNVLPYNHGGRSFGIVRSWSQATEFFLYKDATLAYVMYYRWFYQLETEFTYTEMLQNYTP
jgi:hypothetical protein